MIVVCVGDCAVDRYIDLNLDRPGGTTLNFAVHARRAFASSDVIHVITALGADPEAESVIAALKQHRLLVTLMRRSDATPVQVIRLRRGGEKIFVHHSSGVLEGLEIGSREATIVRSADVLMIPCFSGVEQLFDSVMRVPSDGVRAVDFRNLRDHRHRAATVEKYIDHLNVGFFGLTRRESTLIADLETLAKRNKKIFIVTLGKEGSVALGDFTRIRCRATPVKRVIDTTGAGDTFAAGFLSEYSYSGDIAESLSKGSRMAASVIQRIGAF